MSETLARVVRIEGDTAWVEVEAPTSCGACGGRGCGSTTVFGQLFHARPVAYPVTNAIAAGVGETVVVAVDEGMLLRSALRAYGLPLALLLLGAVLGMTLGGELWAISGAAAGLVLGALQMRRASATRPRIVRHGDAEHFSCSSSQAR
ncbi:MAG: SoxR reducing system RseC family protein [Hydrogenophilaceae bacterium]|nr:SoxR reducing system RseC family protein [Hydrogenophilaceae bacterium]